jgi:hypothetical protein
MPKLTYTTPPPSLMIELHEVAVDAGALASEIARANQLPSNFPTEQLQELLMQLQLLPDGTAEGCRHPLEYARSRLPAIRRTFIQTEERSRVPCANNDIASSLEEWASKMLLDYNQMTGHPLAHEWQSLHGTLHPRHRLMAKRPFVLGGEYSIENLVSLDSVRVMKGLGNLAFQLHGLPDGAKVEFKML